MAKVLRPTRETLQEAWKLGRQMAVYDRRTKADLSGAPHYLTYPLFQVAHRHRIEQSPAFRDWDPKLHAIVERAAKRCRLSPHDPEQWDQFYSSVGRAIHAVFWTAWEDAHQLQQRYDRHMGEHEEEESRSQQSILRVAIKPQPDVQAKPEKDDTGGELWDRVANKVFDQMEADEDAEFWQLPTAESLGAKGGGTA